MQTRSIVSRAAVERERSRLAFFLWQPETLKKGLVMREIYRYFGTRAEERSRSLYRMILSVSSGFSASIGPVKPRLKITNASFSLQISIHWPHDCWLRSLKAMSISRTVLCTRRRLEIGGSLTHALLFWRFLQGWSLVHLVSACNLLEQQCDQRYAVQRSRSVRGKREVRVLKLVLLRQVCNSPSALITNRCGRPWFSILSQRPQNFCNVLYLSLSAQ